MTAALTAAAQPAARTAGKLKAQRLWRALAGAVAGVGVLAIATLNPRAISYFGFTLMLNLAIPIALATIAQMFVIAGNDLDLSIGPFVGFVGCVTATWLRDTPLVGILMLLGCIGVYAAVGALIYLRNLPSIVVTLGMSFVWQGLAILLLPKPGGRAPDWLLAVMGVKRPLVPFPILAALLIAAVAYFGLMRASYGAILRGAGGNSSPWPCRRSHYSGQDDPVASAGLLACCGSRPIGTPPRPTPISATATPCASSQGILGGGEFVGGGSRRSAR
jgi:ribose transport system permease protein